jgi:large conductance mechanosensitive channel
MKKMWEEFKGFLNKGDFVTIAVGLVLALYFQKIVNALLDGVINPIIAAIFGKSNFTDIGFDIGNARISIGLVIDAIISFVVVGFLLFFILKAYDRMRRTKEDPEGETELAVLRDIRDSLGSGRSSGA